MKRTSFAACGIVVLVLFALPVFAQGPFYGRGTGECRYGVQYPGSSLTAEQIDRLGQLRQDYIEKTAGLRGTLWAKRQEIAALMAVSSPDRDRIKKAQAEIDSLSAQLSNARIDHRLKVKEVDPTAFSGLADDYRHCGRRGPGRRYGRL